MREQGIGLIGQIDESIIDGSLLNTEPCSRTGLEYPYPLLIQGVPICQRALEIIHPGPQEKLILYAQLQS